MRINLNDLKAVLNRYFNLMHDKEDEHAVIEQVKGSIAFRGTNLWILMFAILIASLGLNVNSTAVIIGAMLISPLMGPIIGMGLSVGISDFDLMKQSLKNYGVATLISVLTATLYFFISPLSEARSELLARTAPTLYDVLIAFCGGAAGVLALTTKSKGQVIPGVAIATALMPPLCTAGYGLATAQWSYFFGAFYLFFINTVFIALSTFMGVKLLRFHAYTNIKPELAQRGRRLVWIVVVVTMIPAAIMTVNIVKDNVMERNVQHFVERELAQSGTQILSTAAEHDTLRVVAVGRTITDAEVASARGRMADYGLKGYGLTVIQGSDAESVEALSRQINNIVSSSDAAARRLNAQVAELEHQLENYSQYDTLTVHLVAEVGPLFPQVESIAVGRIGGGTVALVAMKKGAALAAADRSRMEEWLKARCNDDALEVVMR